MVIKNRIKFLYTIFLILKVKILNKIHKLIQQIFFSHILHFKSYTINKNYI